MDCSDELFNLAPPDQHYIVSDDGQEHIHRQEKLSTAPAAAFPAATSSESVKEGFHTVTIKDHFSGIPSKVPSLTASDLSATHLATTTESSKYQHRQRSTAANQISSATKVTIGVSVMVGVLVIIGFIVWHLRMKMRFRNKKRISRPIKSSSPPASPLISPSSSHAAPPKAPLTPPARLQERRFLLPRALSLRRTNQRRQYQDVSVRDKAGMPLAPLSPLSVSRVRRSPGEDERRGITATTTISLTTSPTRPPRDDTPSESSIPSVFSHVSTARATSNASSTSSAPNKYNSVTAAEAPRLPSRVYEISPTVGRLASPGPPPTRALPSLPLDGRASPLKPPLSPTSLARRGSPSFGSISESSIDVSEGSGDFQRPQRGNGRSDSRGSIEVPLKSPRRVRHVRSPLLNEVRLDKVA